MASFRPDLSSSQLFDFHPDCHPCGAWVDNTEKVPYKCATFNENTCVIPRMSFVQTLNDTGIGQILSIWYCNYWDILDESKWYVAATNKDVNPDYKSSQRDSTCALPEKFGIYDNYDPTPIVVQGAKGQALSGIMAISNGSKITKMTFYFETIYYPGMRIRPDPVIRTIGCTNCDGDCKLGYNTPTITNPFATRLPSPNLFINQLVFSFSVGRNFFTINQHGITCINYVQYLDLNKVIDRIWNKRDETSNYCCTSANGISTPVNDTEAICILMKLNEGVAGTNCKSFYGQTDYCSIGDRFLDTESGCMEYCSLKGSNCDRQLNEYCSNKVTSADTLANDPHLARVCGCFQPLQLQEEKCSNLQKHFNVPIPCARSDCFDKYCYNPQSIKSYNEKQGNNGACPNISLCLESISFDNQGVISGNVNLSQNPQCSQYVSTNSEMKENVPPSDQREPSEGTNGEAPSGGNSSQPNEKPINDGGNSLPAEEGGPTSNNNGTNGNSSSGSRPTYPSNGNQSTPNSIGNWQQLITNWARSAISKLSSIYETNKMLFYSIVVLFILLLILLLALV